MRNPLLIPVVLLVGGCTRSALEPEKVIEKAIAAHGGNEKLSKFMLNKIEGTTTGKDVDLTWEETFHFPGRLRKSLKGKFDGQKKDNLFVQNGERAWSQDNGGEVVATSPNWEAGGILGQIVSLPTLIDQKGKKHTPIRDFNFAGRSVVGIKVENTESYFDKKTWLMAGIKINLKIHPKEVIVETAYSDYKDIEGVNLPQKLEIKMNGIPFFTHHITKITILDKVDDNLFDKPN